MSEEALDALLKRMPDIASAVNAFQSETIQQEAFAALVTAYMGKTLAAASRAKLPADAASDEQPDAKPDSARTADREGRPKRARKSAGGGRDTFRIIKDLDLHPSGKQSFAEFSALKEPKSNEDKFAVAVYWFKHIGELSSVSQHHVGTAFRIMRWREPGDLGAGLRVTANRKGTIDTSNLDDIKTTPTGRNFVEHDLPTKKKANK